MRFDRGKACEVIPYEVHDRDVAYRVNGDSHIEHRAVTVVQDTRTVYYLANLTRC